METKNVFPRARNNDGGIGFEAIAMKVVITGGYGFVGKHLIEELRSNWQNVEIASWDLPGVDITKAETYKNTLEEFQPDWIVHLAAIASVSKSLKQPNLVYQVNVEGTRLLLETITQVSKSTKILVISSADIYGDTANEYREKPIPELSLQDANPNNPYAQSKWDMEKVIEDQYNNLCIRVRPFPHIGPGQGKGFVTADFASQIAEIEKSGGNMHVGNLTAKRDFTDVRDTVRAYRLLMEKGQQGHVYHVASGRAVSIQHILDTMLHMSTATITVEQDPDLLRPSDTPVIVGSAEKLKNLTNWKPQIPLEQSLQDTLNWWRSR